MSTGHIALELRVKGQADLRERQPTENDKWDTAYLLDEAPVESLRFEMYLNDDDEYSDHLGIVIGLYAGKAVGEDNRSFSMDLHGYLKPADLPKLRDFLNLLIEHQKTWGCG
ncbi:MAG TPA: hypothetical protein VJ890_21215 [Vineibacter sp.]|nr:hypothetical protein [Vineibacter sp.]